MSGAGRKSAYRKSVTEDVLNSFPEPDTESGEHIAQVVQSRGGNILQVRLEDGEESLAILPTKFRKLIWVKRGDFIIVQSASHDFLTAAGDKGKVKFMVEHILYRDQIKHLKEKNMWPEVFADEKDHEEQQQKVDQQQADAIDAIAAGGGSEGEEGRRKEPVQEEEVEEKKEKADGDGQDEDEEDYDDESSEEDYSDLHVNNNRLAKMHLYYDDDDDDNEEEEEEEEEDEEKENES